MNSLTEDSLGIYWLVEEKNNNGDKLKSEAGYEQVNGVIAYGFWKNSKPSKTPKFPKEYWPKKTKMSEYSLFGDDWYVLRWDIRIIDWPHEKSWENTLFKTLGRMLDQGAKVSWCGIDENFIEPPSLFDPNEMPSRGIYACATKELGFKCTAKLGEEYKGIDEIYMKKLKEIISKD